MRRVLLKALLAVVILIGALATGAYGYLRRSLPESDGTVIVSGLSAPVDIIRDADSVTHVFGKTKLDAYYGLGYAHAQDRLWQMEFQRRVGHGRLSEIFGTATLATDRFLRTLGTGRAARAAWESLAPQTKTELECLRRRRQRVHLHASRQPAAARVHDAAVRARAVDGPRRAGVDEDDGVGPEQELLDGTAPPRRRLACWAPTAPPICFRRTRPTA